MSIFSVLNPWRRRRELTALAEQLAKHCRHDVWQRIAHRAGELQESESRGYIRARAATVIRKAVREVIDDKLVFASDSDQLIEMTTQAVVTQLSTQLAILKPTTVKRVA